MLFIGGEGTGVADAYKEESYIGCGIKLEGDRGDFWGSIGGTCTM